MMSRIRRFSSGAIRSRRRSSSSGPSPKVEDECDLVRDTLASVLRTLGSFALPTKRFPGAGFTATMERLAREVLLKPGSPERDNNVERVHKEIRNIVREQRREESREYSRYKDMSTELLATLVSELKRAFMETEAADHHVVSELEEIEDLTYKEQWEALQEKVPSAVNDIKNVLSERRSKEKERIEALSSQLREMRQELQQAKEKMERDPLTGLYNRGAMDNTLKLAMKYADRTGQDLSIFMIDLDHFKKINDTYGHQAGDEVLRQVASTLVKTFMRKHDFVARYGGEEFLVICKDVDAEDAGKIAERARRAIEELDIEFDGERIPVTASIGYATMRRGESPEELIERADKALYRAKAEGRNRVVAAE